MERVIITTLCYHGTDCRVTAWQSNGKISRICLEDPREERLLGSIHVGKVQKILPDIKGAFVEIENRTSCYFPYTKESNFLYTMPKKASELRAGDELLVQVTREAIKTKAPCVSSNLNFTGKYLVLTTGNRTLGISAKIPSGKREKLKEFLEELMPEDCSYGIILRTNGALASAEELKEELRSLETQFTQLYQKALHTPCYTKLSKGESITASILKDVHWKETEKIITDQKTLYEELCVSRQDIPVASMCAIEYYEDSLLPLARLYNLERELDQALQEKIWLKSGGFLIIQQTEAFVAIDVNTGAHQETDTLEKNGIAVCEILLTEGIVADLFSNHKVLGELILIDRVTNMTSACGVVDAVSEKVSSTADRNSFQYGRIQPRFIGRVHENNVEFLSFRRKPVQRKKHIRLQKPCSSLQLGMHKVCLNNLLTFCRIFHKNSLRRSSGKCLNPNRTAAGK